MSIMEADIQWFIARDGKQHGPVSDLEMRKLVELGHLRSTDLIWRQGFPDWRPAPAVFAIQSPPPASQFVPSSRPQAQTRQVQQQTTAPRYDSTAGHPASVGHPQARRPIPAQKDRTNTAAAAHPANARVTTPTPAELRPQTGPVAGNEMRTDPANRPNAKHSSGGPKGRTAAVVALLAILGGGGWLAYQNLEALKQLAEQSKSGVPSQASKAGTGGASKEASEAAVAAKTANPAPETKPAAPTADDAAATLDARLQKTKHWSLVRQEFGEWYKSRVAEAGRLVVANKPAREVDTYLIEGLVELRRANADTALATSSTTLRDMANAFLGNIARLSQESTDACMAFILKGEASPPVIEIIENPQKNAEINSHFAAIFSAVAEGRKSPVKHTDPSDADYQLLVGQLTKLGWTQADLQLFADPQGPSKTTPQRYCKMMQEFFSAHLAVENAAAQDRLLYRTLKLVVAG